MGHRVKPGLSVLAEDQIQTIHDTALNILGVAGIRVDDPKAVKIFEKATGGIGKQGKISIPRDLVEWAIKTAPRRIELYRRDGQLGYRLDSRGDEQTVFGIGVTNLYYQEPLSDRVVPFERSHMVSATRLGDILDEFDTISTPGVIQGVDPLEGELLGVLEMVANTRKPLVLLVSESAAFEASLRMIDELVGISTDRPFVMPYFNPITPLILNAETTTKLNSAISKGLPVIFSNYGMSGATCPITPGGTLALLTAELLAGLVYCQLLKEGTPVVLGSLPATFDMASMLSMYSPKSMLLNLACAEMMAHYGVPHCGTSGGWVGWGPDLQASSMLWANHMTSMLGKVGMAPFVGSNFDSLVFSPATVVYAADIIRFTRSFGEGISLAADEIGLEEILSMGSGANYLYAESTLAKFKDYMHSNPVWPMFSLEKWEENGYPRAGDVLRKYTQQLVDTASPPHDHDQILSHGERLIQKLCDNA